MKIVKRCMFILAFVGLLFSVDRHKVWAAEDIFVSAVCTDKGARAGETLDCEITLVDLDMDALHENLVMTAWYQLDDNAAAEELSYTLDGDFLNSMQFGDTQTFHMQMILPGDVCGDSVVLIRVGNEQILGEARIELEQAGAYEEEKLQGQWIQSGNRWWYRFSDGSWISDMLFYIDGKIYGFDKSGWMMTGWGIQQGKWYYFSSSGSMMTGWIKDRGTWYYMNIDGTMATGWIKLDNQWYYLKNSGAMATGWAKVDNQWYYLKSSGAMATGWIKVNGQWYYLKDSGAMATGWIQSGGKWYYLYSNGSMAENSSVQGYWVGADGAWIR